MAIRTSGWWHCGHLSPKAPIERVQRRSLRPRKTEGHSFWLCLTIFCNWYRLFILKFDSPPPLPTILKLLSLSRKKSSRNSAFFYLIVNCFSWNGYFLLIIYQWSFLCSFLSATQILLQMLEVSYSVAWRNSAGIAILLKLVIQTKPNIRIHTNILQLGRLYFYS